MNFKKTFAVAKWEYLEKVKTKTFLISLILTPTIIIGLTIAPTIFSNKSETTTKAIGIVDTSNTFPQTLINELGNIKLKNGQPRFIPINLFRKNISLTKLKHSADKLVIDNRIEGYLLFLNAGTDSLKVEYRSSNTGNIREINLLQRTVNKVRIIQKLKKAGVNSGIIKIVLTNVKFTSIKIEKSGEESGSNIMMIALTSFIFIILLMFMILSSGGMLVRSLVEEKSNKLIEILISSCSPDELLTGKIFGLSSLGLTQILIWLLIGISIAASTNTIPHNAFTNLIPILVYFILGFIFYTAIFVGIGSIVNSEQEAQQITSYLSVILIIPIALIVPVMENPNSLFVQILSYIPFTLPSIMILRLNIISLTITEIIITLIIMILSIVVTIKLASRIFKIGILSYGKRPSLKEIIEWIK